MKMVAHERKLALYYAIMLGSMGFTGPFFAPWLAELDVNARFIGLIVALPSIAMVLTTVYLGSLADRLKDWRTAIIASDFLVVVLLSWLLFRTSVADIIIVWTLTGLLIAAKIPVADAAALSYLRRRGGEYGKIRASGSIGYVVSLLLAGVVFEHFGFESFVIFLVFGAAARALASLCLPQLRQADMQDRKTATFSNKLNDEAGLGSNLSAPSGNLASATASFTNPSVSGGLGHPGFLLVISGSAIIGASHAFLSGFGIMHWLGTGISKSVAAWLFACAVIAEIFLMWAFASVAKKFSARYCMIVAGGAGMVRWSLSTIELPLPYLFLLQIMHALTYGLMFIATVNFISRRVDDSVAAKAQSLYATITTGSVALAAIASGLAYASIGIAGYWLMVIMCMAGALLIGLSFCTDLETDSPLSTHSKQMA